MKKIALTSLLAVVAASAAHASINVIDGNPLYMPQKGHFYSETSLESDTDMTTAVELGEEFGYGITDRFAVSVSTSVAEDDWFDGNRWGEMGIDATYRLIGDGAWKLDVMAGFALNPMWDDHRPFLDKDDTRYMWGAGVRGGYVNNDWTIAAHANFIYQNTEAFNWGKENVDDLWNNHMLNLGVAGHWTMSDTWSALVTADYFKSLDRYNDEEAYGYWTIAAGLNYNIDTTKYVGVYITKDIDHEGDGWWSVENGFGFGAKFGIDF